MVRLDRRPSQARQQQLLQLPVQRPELTLLLSPAVRRSYFCNKEEKKGVKCVASVRDNFLRRGPPRETGGDVFRLI